MIRQPTPEIVQYAWHDATLAGRLMPVYENEPECGWFRMRMVKGGPWVPVRIWLDQNIDPDTGELTDDEIMRCEVGAERRSPAATWTRCAGKPITEDDYYALMGRKDDETMRATHAPIDLTERAIRP